MHRKHWTDQEDLVLTLSWTSRTPKDIADELGRSYEAVMRRSQTIGLSAIPTGWETLKKAAERLGFKGSTLKLILNWNKTPAVFSRNSDPVKKYRHMLVRTVDADKAVAKWMSYSTPVEWGRHLGLTRGYINSVIRHAKEVGLLTDRDRFTRKKWRVSLDKVHKMIASYQRRVDDFNERRKSGFPARKSEEPAE